MRTKLFGFLAYLSLRWPAAVVLTGLGLAIAGMALGSKLEMRTGRTDLLSSNNPEVRNYTRFTHEFGTANNIYFVLESPSQLETKRCADALASEISKYPSYIRDVLYRLDLESIEHKLLLHLSPQQLEAINQYLNDNADLLENFAGAKNMNDIFLAIQKLADKRSRAGLESPAAFLELGALANLLETINSYLWDEKNTGVEFLPTIAPGLLPFGVVGDPQGYLVGKHGQTVILIARPNAEKEDSIDFLEPMMDSLVAARTKVQKEFPNVSIGMTGLPSFAYGDLRVMRDEMPTLFAAALVIVIIIFFLFFRYPIEIAFASAAMLGAIACALGATKLLIGHLNIMSSVFAVTLVSLGIDFGVHFIARFNDERSKSESFEEAMKRTMAGCGPPVSTGALTTATAFYLLSVSDFTGLAEVGVIAGTGIALCLIFMLTILPSLISIWHRVRPYHTNLRAARESLITRMLGRFATANDQHTSKIITATVAGTLIMCYFAPRVTFDYNFLHIQPATSTTGEYEEILMERTGLAPSFNVIVKDDLESLKEIVDELRRMPTVSRVDSASDLVPTHQERRIPDAKLIVERIAMMREQMRGNHAPTDLGELVVQYKDMQTGLKTAIGAKALIEDQRVVSQMERSEHAAELFLDKFKNADPAIVSRKLEACSNDLFAYMEKRMAILGSERQLGKITFDDFPENIKTRFEGRTGKYAAYVFPSQSIWNKKFLDQFNADVRKLAPDAAGTAMFAQTLLDVSAHALKQCGILVFGAIVLLVFLDFKKVIPTLLSLLSLTIALIWMLGITDIVGWEYTPLNIMAIPVLLGIGIDNGVHIVHRFRDNGCDSRMALLTSGSAIMVSSLTTIGGIACLLFSTHRGLTGLAELLALGMSACLVASLLVLPAVLKILSDAGIKI